MALLKVNTGIGTTNPTSALHVVGDGRFTGVITASSFVGSGSSLTNLPAEQLTGVLPALNGSALTGIVTYITAGSGISVNQNTGNVTITASGGAVGASTYADIAGIATNVIGGIGSITQLSVSGVSTFNSGVTFKSNATVTNANSLIVEESAGSPNNVKITKDRFSFNDDGNTIANFVWSGSTYTLRGYGGFGLNLVNRSTGGGGSDNVVLRVDGSGNTNVAGSLNVSGVSTFNQDIRIAQGYNAYFGGGNELGIIYNGSYSTIQNTTKDLYISGTGADRAIFKHSGAVELYHSGSKKFETLGAGVTITGTTFTNQLSVSGVSTFAGISTFQSNLFGIQAWFLGSIAASQINNASGYKALDFTTTSTPFVSIANGLNVGTGGTILTTTAVGLVGIGTTNPVSGYNLTVGNDSSLGQVSNSLKVHGYGDINGLIIKGNSTTGTAPYYTNNVIITQHPAATFTGDGNVAIGDYSFTKPGAAKENVALGYFTLNSVGNNITGSAYAGNTGVGAYAGQNATTALYNTLIGWGAGRYVTTGSYNVILGGYDGNSNGLDIRTSSNNVVISDGAGNIKLVGNLNGVGVGTTNPVTPLQVERFGVKTGLGTFSSTAGIATDIDTFTIASTDFKTSEYTLHIQHSSGMQAQKILVMQNGTTAYSEEYAVMFDNSLIVSIGSTISGGILKLQATPETGITGLTTYRFTRQTIL